MSDNFTYKVKPSVVQGRVRLSGAKNSVLRLLAASILTEGDIELTNYPASLLDVQVHQKMLEVLGKKIVNIDDDKVKIIQQSPCSGELIWEGRSIRNTLLILGALVAKNGYGKVPLPGGCKLGERKYDLHVMLLENLGATVSEDGDYLVARAENGLVGNDIELPMRSTGATENSIICASLAQGKTTVWNPHIRPEIIDLINFLKGCGAKIEVFGQERIEIEGVSSLSANKHSVIIDNMEALTWVIAATITGGSLEIDNFPFIDLEVPLAFLKESGVRLYRFDDSAHVGKGNAYPIEISTGPYPGINSDMQPLFAVFGAMSKGTSKIVDLRFPGRYGYAEELAKMGVQSKVVGDMLEIKGGNPLTGETVNALDLRAGIALLLAGLVADGETTILNAWQIERGYNGIIEKLNACGVNIEKIYS
ncbi:UDP-N-acetylglucosamine 1-carboxyvinyltransferase [Paraglaciecola sp. L3A3]|uniref:UDP-N-acetylglucosamine 1-carboxyvinyltransferase n=1 Tax=Paraglaciecola sp. L3A3 TaxID=2686358 RepID=UPI00131D2031|nr:UDP-N-acetylglucosamine 1-carboxyvinyltransferase [Paraglaciecola sp. L3A3]